MTVYVTHQAAPTEKKWTPDLSSAVKYGELKFIFENGYPVNGNNVKSIRIARDALKDFNFEKDYVLWPWGGDPSAAHIAVMILSNYMSLDKINFLIWNRVRKKDEEGNVIFRDGYYIPVCYDLKELY
jgi:hypothetical protein